MKLYIVRHGQAEPEGLEGDFGRKLTAQGFRELELMAGRLVEFGCAPELIVHSPLVRTTQTAEVLQVGLGCGERLISEGLKPGASPDRILEELGGFSEFESIMVVGHAPDVAVCSYRFLNHEPARQLRFEPGTVAGIWFTEKLQFKAGSLEYFCTPGEIDGF